MLYNIHMNIYKLIHFEEKDLLFSERGYFIYYYTYPITHTESIFRHCMIRYFNEKEQQPNDYIGPAQVRIIDFNKLDDTVKGLFIIYKRDISSIKHSMTVKQWRNFLRTNSILSTEISKYPEEEY